VSGYQVAKVVTVREEGGGDLMAVLPAACRLDLPAFRQATGRRRLSLLREEEMKPLFPDCEVGAMPPFGHLYGLPVYVDACFPRAKDIVFQAGNHHEVVRMPYPEYERLARPVVVEICHHQREKTLGE
jgi:Ala-tRNA(Pro) deacylase